MNVSSMVIKSRRSVRKFKEAPIGKDILRDVLDCARLAPTAVNRQPWLFGCVTDRAALAEIGRLADHGSFIAEAAACIAVFCRKDEKYYLEDGAAATMNLITAFQGHGVGTCWVAGDKKTYVEDVRRLLNVPEAYTLVSLVAAGLPAEIANPPKKRLEEVVFYDRYVEEQA